MRKVRKYNHGFTLVEMITTITILGIVSLLALPVINNLSNGFNGKKFANYEESLLASAKLYVDQNMDDLFGYSDDGCVDIKFNEMSSKNVLKDIAVDNATCKSDNTFVRVHKNGSSYNYEISISCKYKGEVVYEKTLESSSSCQPIGDNPEAGEIPGGYVPVSTAITSDPTEWLTPVKTKDVTILVSDEKGFTPNVKIRYWWVKGNDEDAVVGSKKTKDFKNAMIKSSHTFRLGITTPSDYTGDLKLKVEPVNVITSDGRQVTITYTSGIFKVDNTAPTINIKASYFDNNTIGNFVKEATNSDLVISDWQNHGYYLDFTGTSDNYNGFAYTQTWKFNKPGTAELVENHDGGTENDNAITNKTFVDRGARYGTVKICDVAGNCASKKVKVNISTIYSVKFDGNGADSGKVSDISCLYGIDCKLPNNGFSKVGHSFDKWKVNDNEYDQGANVKYLTKKDGGSVTAKVKWKKNIYTVTYFVNDTRKLNGNWTTRSVAYGDSIDTSLNPQSNMSPYRKFVKWTGVPDPNKMPAHDITLTANTRDYMCKVVTGHGDLNRVDEFNKNFAAEGWSSQTEPFCWEGNCGYRVKSITSGNYEKACDVLDNVFKGTSDCGDHALNYIALDCENGAINFDKSRPYRDPC